MANRHQDSFDHYSTALRAAKGWSFGLAGASPGDRGCTIGAYGRNSTNGLRCFAESGFGNSSRATLTVSGVSGATAIVGCAFKINSSLPGNETVVMQIWNASAAQISVTCSTGGALSVRRGGLAGTIIETTSTTITHSTWYFLELKVLFHDSAGTYELRINGVPEASDTGVDTVASGSAGWDSVVFGNEPISNNHTHDIDDLYVFDGSGGVNDDFAGDHRQVWVPMVSGNGANDDWSKSTGSDAGALVDENPPNTSDFLQSGTSGQRVTMDGAAIGVAGTVRSVQFVNYLSAQVAGVRSVGPSVRIGSTNYDYSGDVVGSDWTYQLRREHASPATAMAWTTAEIDAMERGAKVTA